MAKGMKEDLSQGEGMRREPAEQGEATTERLLKRVPQIQNSTVTQSPIMPARITIRLSELRYLSGATVHWVKTADTVEPC